MGKADEKEKAIEEILETIMTKNFPQINVRHQTTDPGGSERSNRRNAKQTKNYFQDVIFKRQKINYKEKNPDGSVSGGDLLTFKRTKVLSWSWFPSATTQVKYIGGKTPPT